MNYIVKFSQHGADELGDSARVVPEIKTGNIL